MIKNTTLFLSLVLTLIVLGCQTAPEQEIADKIITNGNIYTVDEDLPSASALAIKDGRIIAVGSD